jgi:hypothetical protein
VPGYFKNTCTFCMEVTCQRQQCTMMAACDAVHADCQLWTHSHGQAPCGWGSSSAHIITPCRCTGWAAQLLLLVNQSDAVLHHSYTDLEQTCSCIASIHLSGAAFHRSACVFCHIHLAPIRVQETLRVGVPSAVWQAIVSLLPRPQDTVALHSKPFASVLRLLWRSKFMQLELTFSAAHLSTISATATADAAEC